MSKYSAEDFRIGEEVKVTYEILNKISKKIDGRIIGIDTKRLKKGVLKIEEGKTVREVAVMYITDVDKLVEKVDKYKKLTIDLIEAKARALDSMKKDYGGVRNSDEAFLILPRWRESKVEEAFKKAEIPFKGKVKLINTGYLINIGGAGNDRVKATKTFVDYLNSKGYKALVCKNEK